MPCACGARGTSAARAGLGFALNTTATFDVFYWLQVTNFDVLFDSASNGANHFDVWDFGIHAKTVSQLDRVGWVFRMPLPQPFTRCCDSAFAIQRAQ
jgi:hypothetical protein